MHHGESPSPPAVLFLIVFTFCSASATSPGDETIDEPSTTYEERVEVLAAEPGFESVPLDLELLETGRTPNIAVALTTLAGVAGVSRSLNSYEPVIHGMGWERVQTQVNGMPLYGACPARMDPPAFLLGGAAASEIEVVKGLASVTLGPAGTGGRVAVTTDHDRGVAAGREVEPWARAGYDGATDGFRGGAGVRGGTDQVDYALGLEYLDQGDYVSAGGLSVPAGQTDSSGFVSFGHRPTDAQRWSVGAIRHEGEEIAYPSLPMDTDNAETSIYSGGYRYQPAGGGRGLSAVELKLGYSSLDHRMSNRERTNRPMMQAESVSEAGTWSLGVATRWLISPRSLVRGGFDLNTLQRDALRRRHMTASGMTFSDHLWPDVSQNDLGLYAESAHALRSDWRLRAGLRYDDVRSEAAAADDPALGGGTIRQAYVRFYGPQAAETDRDEGLFSGNVVVSKELGERVILQGGLGIVARAAGVTERYFAFAPAPNGFLVGNPSLDAERKREYLPRSDLRRADLERRRLRLLLRHRRLHPARRPRRDRHGQQWHPGSRARIREYRRDADRARRLVRGAALGVVDLPRFALRRARRG